MQSVGVSSNAEFNGKGQGVHGSKRYAIYRAGVRSK